MKDPDCNTLLVNFVICQYCEGWIRCWVIIIYTHSVTNQLETLNLQKGGVDEMSNALPFSKMKVWNSMGQFHLTLVSI